MGEIQIQKVQRTVQVKDADNKRKKVQKTYGKIIYRGTLSLNDMAEHIMKHGSVYTEDVVIGVITKLKTCLQEMLADGYKVKLDGIGTLYPVCSSEGVADAKDYSASENVTRVGISFLADQSKKSLFKARAMRNDVSLSTKLYSELTGEEELTPNATPHSQGENPSPSGEGSGNTGNGNTGGNQGGNGGGDEPGGDGNDQN
jgi:predicted histone-like DNA-binding protein